MQLKTLEYRPERGWSGPAPVELDSEQTMIIVFGASDYMDTPQQIVQFLAQFPRSLSIGCSTAGEIFGTRVEDEGLVVAVAQFESTQLCLAEAVISTDGISDEGSEAAGKAIGDRLASNDLRAVFLLSDGLHVNGSELVRGLNEKVASTVVVSGGLAGDGEHFQRTWVLHNGVPAEGLVSAIGLYGDALRVGHGSKGGWDIFGPERRVTRSKGNVLYELDGRPALTLYKEYLGELAADLPGSALRFPLSLRETYESEKSLVRTVLAVDEAEQSMTFAGDVPQGWQAQLMRANFNNLIDGAEQAASMTSIMEGSLKKEGLAEKGRSGAVLALAISCVGRRMVLGVRIEDETEATLDVLPSMAQQIGFYSYGELSPYANGSCELHNQTMTLTTFSERGSPVE